MLAFCQLHPNPFMVELPVSTKNPSVFTGDSAATYIPAESASVALVVCLWRPSACKMAPQWGQPRCRAGSLGAWEVGKQNMGRLCLELRKTKDGLYCNFTVCYGYGFDEPFTVCYGFHDKSRFQRCVFPCDCNK